MGGIVRGDADLDPVSHHDFDAVLFHAPGKYTPYGNVVVTLDFHCAAAQNTGDYTFYLN